MMVLVPILLLATRNKDEVSRAISRCLFSFMIFLSAGDGKGRIVVVEGSSVGGGGGGIGGFELWALAAASNVGLAIAVTAVAGLALAATVVYSRR